MLLPLRHVQRLSVSGGCDSSGNRLSRGGDPSKLRPMITLLLVLQAFHVLFLALHDWIPLGPLNDVRAVRAENSTRQLVLGTLISTIPFAFGVAASLYYFGKTYPGWLRVWLWISYAMLFSGELQAWWVPYLLRPEAQRAVRYDAMFGRTHGFLPTRNGIRPNTLHIILHTATALTLVVLWLTRH